jgi:uncharacterized repeat protein (TIGR03806 family)
VFDRITIALAALILTVASCGAEVDPEGSADEATIPYDTLAEYGFFEGNGATQIPVDGVVPFEVISVLFSDFAGKFRFIVLPDGETMDYLADDIWELPTGSIVIKTFVFEHDMRDPSLGFDIVETRLIIRTEGGWVPHVYLWNDEETEATRYVAGARVPVTWIDLDGDEQSIDYRVPDTNACLGCHGTSDRTNLLGVHTRQLNRDNDYGDGPVNQLEHFASRGMFSGPLPSAAERAAFPAPTDQSAPVEARARAYLDANCAHCHSTTGAAYTTGLYLGRDVTDESALGVCRRPFSAGQGTGGRSFDIVPGAPDESIITYRMESTDPQVKMPELPAVLADIEGAALVADWIRGMDAVSCE